MLQIQIKKIRRKRQARLWLSTWLVTLILLPLAVGCDNGLQRVKMSGKVTFADQPVEDGQIRFTPKPGTKMPLTVVPIAEGHYDTSTVGGIPAGSYRVEIRAWNPNQPRSSGPGMPGRKQLLPAKYVSKSTLEITLKAGQPAITQDYELTP